MVPPEPEDQFEGGLDPAFSLLADEHRRHLLYLLREHGSATLDDLADVLTAWLAVRHGDGVATPEDRQQIYMRLYHAHVPKLASAGVVEFDEDSGTVTLDRLPPMVDHLLDEALELEPETTAETIAAAEPQNG